MTFLAYEKWHNGKQIDGFYTTQKLQYWQTDRHKRLKSDNIPKMIMITYDNKMIKFSNIFLPNIRRILIILSIIIYINNTKMKINVAIC